MTEVGFKILLLPANSVNLITTIKLKNAVETDTSNINIQRVTYTSEYS